MTLPPPDARRMTIGELFAGIRVVVTAPVAEIVVRGVRDDSRQVEPGDMFIARRGTRSDGHQHIKDAIVRGAVAVVVDAQSAMSAEPAVPVLVVPNLSARAGEIAAVFYGHPSRHMTVIAVTGTNGKTTCSWLVAAALARLGEQAAVIGTLGVGVPPHCEPLLNTTPGAVELQRLLARLDDAGIPAVAIEASSIGIEQHRLDAVSVDVAVFTNLSHDHLDYHGDMATYAAAKARLFRWPGLKGAVLNIDDPVARDWRRTGQVHAGTVMTFGGATSDADLRLMSCDGGDHGTQVSFAVAGERIQVSEQLPGEFNGFNILAVAGVLLALGYAVDQLDAALVDLPGPPGRMERIGGCGEPHCIIDYAHSPDALEKVLRELGRTRRGDLWCVFGCGGDRDRAKRPRMGEVAARLADHVVVTSDNPRSESPRAITEDIVAGMGKMRTVTVLLDRAAAIRHAVCAAGNDDTVLVAGKGHEQYQDVNGVRLAFSDQAQVRDALVARQAGVTC